MRLVIAIGGNALLERGQKPDAAIQRANALRAVAALAPLAA
jgi:carbamate kinase